MQESKTIRQPVVAGSFYSRQKSILEKDVAIFLENAPDVIEGGEIFGLVAPHAGYMYSGGVAGRAYRQIINRQYDVVVVIAPSHRVYFEEVSVYSGQGYSTPLGDAPVDVELARKIAETDPQLIYSDLGHHVEEHALEVQLPFLQHVLGDFRLIPIVMGNQDMQNIEILADALGRHLAGRKALIVASSDLSHFHNYNKASLMDNVVVDRINAYDEDGLYKDLESSLCEMCGGGPVIATMKACRALGAKKSKVLVYRNSGDVIGDRGQVVGYLSAIFYR